MATAPSGIVGRWRPRRALGLSRGAFNGAVLVAFITVRALVTVLLDLCKSEDGGYPFVFQTLLLFPFLLQILFYIGQTCASLGVSEGLTALLEARKAMLPAVFYSLMVALSMLLQTLSQSFLEASTFVVLMQLTLVFVALGERYILRKTSNAKIWGLIMLQVVCVSTYEMSSSADTGADDHGTAAAEDSGDLTAAAVVRHSKFVMGVVLCLSANISSATGNILQQQFMQSASVSLPASIKLCYQHIIGFFLTAAIALLQPSARGAIWERGFFDGWDRSVVLTSFCMWLSFLAASSVTAYISAMAGAMGSAVVVIVVGTYDVFFRGKALSPLQAVCVLAIAGITATYTYLKDLQARRGKRADDASPRAAERSPGNVGRSTGKQLGNIFVRRKVLDTVEPFIV